jgi:hypothetical protein
VQPTGKGSQRNTGRADGHEGRYISLHVKGGCGSPPSGTQHRYRRRRGSASGSRVLARDGPRGRLGQRGRVHMAWCLAATTSPIECLRNCREDIVVNNLDHTFSIVWLRLIQMQGAATFFRSVLLQYFWVSRRYLEVTKFLFNLSR